MDGVVCSGVRDGDRAGFADRARPRSRRRRRGPRGDPRTRARGRRRRRCSGALLIGLAALRGMPNWQSIPSNWDSVWHANTIRFILDTGQASPTHMGELRNVETHEALYYPSTFHALAAVFSQLTGAAPTTAYTLNSLAAAIWLFPVSAATLTWQLLRTTNRRVARRPVPRPRPPHCRRRSPRSPTSSSTPRRCPTSPPTAWPCRPWCWSCRRCGTATASRWPCWRCWGVLRAHHRRRGGRAVRGGVVVVRRAVASGPRPHRRLRQPVAHRHPDGAAAAAAVLGRAAAGRDHRRARVRHA